MKIALMLAVALISSAAELRFAFHAEPKTLDPFLMADENAAGLSYLTEGVLIRVNRLTQQLEPELATSWKVENHGTRITFKLREGVAFPNGVPFTSADVVATFRALLDPALHSPIADTFKSDKGAVEITAPAKYAVIADFPAPVGQIERLFDQVAIVSSHAANRPAPGLGPYVLAERKPGVSIQLKRNPAYWKRPLPPIDSIHIDIEQNRDIELLRFRRGELHLIDKLTPDLYQRLASDAPGSALDAGPTLDFEFLWFNLAQRAPLRDPAKQWYQSVAFRKAVSQAIHRDDLCRVVYRGHASPAAGPVSPANKLWFKQGLAPEPFNLPDARKRLAADGFRLDGSTLRDRSGNAVEFSLITNAGSKTREQMAAMIQDDLAKLGMKINIVTLDFPSLIERVTRNLNYEACLLGLVNVDADPSELMNVLLSSASNHTWNPAEKTPETAWEAEIDRLMLAQAATADYRLRKKNFDRVQEILAAQVPVIYLLHPNSLSAVSPQISGVRPTPLFPHTYWDVEHLTIRSKGSGGL
jgi:peptide/nickel transport system substrate-binding protein